MGLRFGYDQGVMSGLLTGDAFTRTFPEMDTTEDGNGSASLQGTVYAEASHVLPAVALLSNM